MMKNIYIIPVIALMLAWVPVVNAKPGCSDKTVENCTAPHSKNCPVNKGLGEVKRDELSNTTSINECIVIEGKCQGGNEFMKCSLISTDPTNISCYEFLDHNLGKDC